MVHIQRTRCEGQSELIVLACRCANTCRYNPGRTGELSVFTIVIVALIALAVFGYCKGVTLPDADLGGGLSLLRVVSLLGSVMLIMGVYWLWTNTSVNTLDVAVRDLVVQVRLHSTKHV